MSQQSSSKLNNSLFPPLAVGFCIGVTTFGTIVLLWNHDHGPQQQTGKDYA